MTREEGGGGEAKRIREGWEREVVVSVKDVDKTQQCFYPKPFVVA